MTANDGKYREWNPGSDVELPRRQMKQQRVGQNQMYEQHGCGGAKTRWAVAEGPRTLVTT